MNGGDVHNVASAIVHPSWDSVNIKNDVAVLKIEDEFNWSSLTAAIALESHYIAEENCIATGWCRPIANQLQYINLTTLFNANCRPYWGVYPIGPGEICTLTRAGEGVCALDSGSALVRLNGKQIGIVSWSRAGSNGIPAVHTRISYYYEWILYTISPYLD